MFSETEINQIKKTLRASVENNYIAGGNLMIIKEGQEIFYHEDGFADLEKKLPIKRDSIFRLYSMTKPVTAAAVMILLQRGEIDLYDSVSQYIPSFKNQKVALGDTLVPAEREVTLKDLLSMTSGLVYGGNHRAGKETDAVFQEIDKRLLGNSPMTTLEIINKLGQCPLAFQPGSYWEYGTSADVLGAVVEVVSGKSFGQFLKEEIFEPLGMKDTDFWVPEEKRSRLAKTYEDDGKGSLSLYTGNHLGIIHQMDRKPAFESGGAGLASTIDDYGKFAKMLMNEGTFNGVEILKPKTVKHLTSGTLTAAQQKGFDTWVTFAGHSYGNLMRVMTDCGKAGDLASLGEYGWDGWLGAYFANSPKDDLTILFMIQKTGAGTSTVTRKLRNIILGSCSK
ncbi:beta-lactamase family protein [Clostridium sp. 19966]|uniref:serine hydrolase domain-containing protein n=1 Tax=Clostridium sp. 19966 TaxID=2768166 RepID=UPI0028DD60CE|nr:serine hydrolase domain-containing protein [Clostridium sp. 19966]MDT8717524.1 beta-lactamase family protein [Clostridium sp. 19966]